jgi:hypothetical protein
VGELRLKEASNYRLEPTLCSRPKRSHLDPIQHGVVEARDHFRAVVRTDDVEHKVGPDLRPAQRRTTRGNNNNNNNCYEKKKKKKKKEK